MSECKLDVTCTIYKSMSAWMDAGIELFGEDYAKWKFQCPACGNIATPADFKKYKHKGATMESAYLQCLGCFADSPECEWVANGIHDGPSFIHEGKSRLAVFNFYTEDTE